MPETVTVVNNINGCRCFLGLTDALMSGYESGLTFDCQGCPERRCRVKFYIAPLLKRPILALDPTSSGQVDRDQVPKTGFLPRP